MFVFLFFFIRTIMQLRVIRAFRSTLEDLEERRSVHSLHSLRSLRSQLNPNLAYFNTGTQKNLTPFAAYQQYQQQLLQQRDNQSAAAAMSSNLPDMSFIDEDNGTIENGGGRGQRSQTYNDDLPRPIHETRI